MATTAGISLEQFLATHFDDPQPDFVDGEVRERSMPDWTHSGIQWSAGVILGRAPGITIRPELRVRLADRSYIIDVCAYPAGVKMPRFPSTPPVVAAEILSMDDRATDVNAKLEAYLKWGVPHIWLIDPWTPRLNVYNERGLLHVAALEIPEFGVRITLDELIANL